MSDSDPHFTLKEAEKVAAVTVLKTGWLAWCRIRALEAFLYPCFRLAGFFKKGAPKRGSQIARILVVEYANFGDIVLLLPFLDNLRLHYPGAHVSLVANPKTTLLLKGLGLVDEVIPVRVPQGMFFSRRQRLNYLSSEWREARRRMRELQQRNFDLALTARIDVVDNWLLWMTGASRRVGYGLKGGRFFLTDVVKPDLDHVHGSDRWLAMLDALGKSPVRCFPRLRILPEEESSAAEWLMERGVQEGDFVVGIHPGARVAIRQWGDENFRAVVERLRRELQVKIVWFQDPAGGARSSLEPEGTIPAMLKLREFIALLARCRVLICNDSGPMHIASALGVRIVTIFGPERPEWFGPLGAGHRVIVRGGFWCRPCGDHCRFDRPYCLRTISKQEVFSEAAQAILSLGGRRQVTHPRELTSSCVPVPTEERRS